MKKNILNVVLIATLVMVAGYNVYSSQKTEVMSDIAICNVEALADLEYNGNKAIYDTLVSMEYNPYAIIATYKRECAFGGREECTEGTYTIVTRMN